MNEVPIPMLETGRLQLLPLTKLHSNGMFELFSSNEVCRYCQQAVDVEGRKIELPVGRHEESDKIIDFFLDYAAKGKGFRWAMIEKGSGTFAGALGFNSLGRTSELAYHQIPRFWGQGMMTEACLRAIKWVREESGCEHVEAFIESGNQLSIKLIKRLGFRSTREEREGAIRYVL